MNDLILKSIKFPEYEYGDPAMYISKSWFVDGETGQVYTEEEFKNRIKSQEITRTFQGKPTLKKKGKPLSKNPMGKSTKLNKDKKHLWERLFG